MNLINCLLDRCYRICSSYDIICDKFEQIKTMLSRNDYSKYVLDKCTREFFYRKHTTKSSLSKKKHFHSKKDYIIRLPLLDALSLQFCNELKSFLGKHANDKASVYILDN